MRWSLFPSLRKSRGGVRPAVRLNCEWLEERDVPVSIVFDYRFDDGFFTANPVRQALLQQAANDIASHLGDSLTALPSAARTVSDPSTSALRTTNATYSTPADAITVFVSGASLSGTTIGLSTYHVAFSGAESRGKNQTTNFAPFNGSIAFDDDGSTNWYFKGLTPGNINASSQVNFLSVARHELLHILGISGGQDSWERWISGGLFTGPTAVAANGGVGVAVQTSHDHFAQSTSAFMTPTYRRSSSNDGAMLTAIDWGALQDIGWSYVAELHNNISRAATLFNSPLGTGSTTENIDLASVGGVMMYRLDAIAGSTLTATTSANGNGNVNTYLRLFDASGNELAFNDNFNSTNWSRLTYALTNSGTYYLGVSIAANSGYNPNGTPASANGRFQLAVSLTSTDAVGNTLAAARDTGLSGASGTFQIDSALESYTDVDVYRLQAAAGSTLSGVTSLPTGGVLAADTFLRLFDANGRELLSRQAGGPGAYAAVNFTFPTAGAYYLAVSTGPNQKYNPQTGVAGDHPVDGAGEYRLSITLSAGESTGEAIYVGADFPQILSRDPSGNWWNSQIVNAGLSPAVVGSWGGLGWRDVMYADFTNDGLRDILGRAPDGTWWLAKNTGTSFTNVAYAKWAAINWLDVRAGDFTGDGIIDIVGRAPDGTWWLGRNTLSGFSDSVWGAWGAIGWYDVATGDFNGDGRLDLVGRNVYGSWYLNRNTGNAFQTVPWAVWSPAVTWADVQVADFTGDGLPDLLGRSPDGTWWLSRNNGESAVNEIFGAWAPVTWLDVRIGDFTGDGKPDMAGRTASGAWWVATTTLNGFVNQQFGAWSPAVVWTDVMAGNFYGGGKDEIIGRAPNGSWWSLDNLQPGTRVRSLGSWAAVAWTNTTNGYFYGTGYSGAEAQPSATDAAPAYATDSRPARSVDASFVAWQALERGSVAVNTLEHDSQPNVQSQPRGPAPAAPHLPADEGDSPFIFLGRFGRLRRLFGGQS